jgi:virulence factor Mce-like protein
VRSRRRTIGLRAYALGGVAVLVAGLLVVYLSYRANDGVPFVATYDIVAEVPNADRLARRDAVRIGGVRVGQVADVRAATPRAGEAPHTVVRLKLDTEVGDLPADTTIRIRPHSVLGASYVDLRPGRSDRMLRDGGRLPLEQAIPTVQATDLLDIFRRGTGRDLQRTFGGMAEGVAGRGAAINTTIADLDRLLGPLERVSATMAAPETRLGPLVRSYAGFAEALEPVSGELADMLATGATTMAAFDAETPALRDTLDLSPGTLRELRASMTELAPSLDTLAATVTDLRHATPRLPRALDRLNAALLAGLPPLRQIPATAPRLDAAVQAIDRIARRRSTEGALHRGRQALAALEVTLDTLVPAQLQCNIATVWAQNFASGFGSLGFADGPAVAAIGVTHFGAQGEGTQNAAPSPGVGINNIPHHTAGECETGNEPYDGSQQLTNPPGLQSASTLTTHPPADARERGRRAGLLGGGDS